MKWILGNIVGSNADKTLKLCFLILSVLDIMFRFAFPRNKLIEQITANHSAQLAP